jgi:hypothetical protein
MILEYAIISQVIAQAMLRDLYWPSRKDGSLLGWPFAHRQLAGPSSSAARLLPAIHSDCT